MGGWFGPNGEWMVRDNFILAGFVVRIGRPRIELDGDEHYILRAAPSRPLSNASVATAKMPLSRESRAAENPSFRAQRVGQSDARRPKQTARRTTGRRPSTRPAVLSMRLQSWGAGLGLVLRL